MIDIGNLLFLDSSYLRFKHKFACESFYHKSGQNMMNKTII